jgi:hypothetical protein
MLASTFQDFFIVFPSREPNPDARSACASEAPIPVFEHRARN